MTAADCRAPRLSLCIATLNRSKYISDTLDSIEYQLTEEVEIVVLDGASSDGTEELLRARVQSCKQLRYFRQSKNSGVDQDYSTAVGMCRGDYVWLMTDDDLLKPGAICAVLGAVRDCPSLIVVNAEVRNADMSKILQARRLDLDANRSFPASDSDGLMSLAGNYLSYIGCLVMRRIDWEAREKTPYFGTLFVHVGVIFQEPLPRPALVIAEPFISIRYGNAMWRARDFEIWMFKWPNLIWSFAGLSNRAKTAVCKSEPWRNLKELLLLRAKGSYTAAEYHKWIKPQLQGSWRGRLAGAIAHIPGPLLNSVAVIYGHLARRGTHTGLLDLKASRFYLRNWFLRNGS